MINNQAQAYYEGALTLNNTAEDFEGNADDCCSDAIMARCNKLRSAVGYDSFYDIEAIERHLQREGRALLKAGKSKKMKYTRMQRQQRRRQRKEVL